MNEGQYVKNLIVSCFILWTEVFVTQSEIDGDFLDDVDPNEGEIYGMTFGLVLLQNKIKASPK